MVLYNYYNNQDSTVSSIQGKVSNQGTVLNNSSIITVYIYSIYVSTNTVYPETNLKIEIKKVFKNWKKELRR